MAIFLVGDSWAAMDTYIQPKANIVAFGGTNSQYWSNYLDNFISNGGRLSSDDIIILNAGGNDFLNQLPRETTYNNLKHIAEGINSFGAHTLLVGAPNVNDLSGLLTNFTMDPLFNRIASEVPNTYVSNAMMNTIDRKSTRLNSSHTDISRMPSSA